MFPLRLSYKKQVQGFENFDNNNPATTYGATAASTVVQPSRTETRQTIITDHHGEQQPLIFSRPRPPMQQQNQNRFPGDGDQVTCLQ